MSDKDGACVLLLRHSTPELTQHVARCEVHCAAHSRAEKIRHALAARTVRHGDLGLDVRQISMACDVACEL